MKSSDLRLHFNAQGAARQAALDCEASVFLEAYGNTREELAEEYGPYDEDSSFIAVIDSDGVAQAAARLINPGPVGLKTINDVSRAPWGVDGTRSARAAGLDLDNTWDVATFGVRRGAGRGMLLSAALYHAVILGGTVNSMKSIVMIMDERARRLFTSIGFYSYPLPGTKPAPYLGSAKSTPVWGHRESLIDGQRRANPDAFRLISLGIGLDGISVPPQSDFQLDWRPAPIGEFDLSIRMLESA
ncbi:MAG: hypothetical protein QOK10_3334 [Pseudonocardiales bacterium]|nr:hypothetical protein [Pseudonocardiales bacterium]